MPTTVEELAIWMAAPKETPGLEFKLAEQQYDSTKLFRYCVGIANEGGGKLILGITNDVPRRVVGTRAVNDASGMEKRILEKLRFRVTVEELSHPAGRVVILTNQSLRERFHLPEAKSAIVSQIISSRQDAGFIKTDERSGGSRKFARYVPFWA